MSCPDGSTGSFGESVELSVEQALLLDDVCNTFETKWRSGGRPDIWAAALEIPTSFRTAALKELVQLDAYYRRQNGHEPAAGEYTERFPELDRDWLTGVVEVCGGADPNAQTATGVGMPTTEMVPAFAGQQFAGFEVLDEIARGAMGVVFRAKQSAPMRVVALKVIRAGEFADPAEVRRFRQEAEAAATLDHPNIVSIFEVGECRGVQYYAMRLVTGGSLATQMGEWAVTQAASRAEARLRQKRAAELVAAAARAVNHAHQRRILHRDLKPGNILVDETGAPHVTDFGLARRIGKDSTLTRTGAILGTPNYMAPEQARGREDVTTGVDVYGLGAVMYELLAGRPPFVGEDVLDTLYRVREREPLAPRTHCPAVDRDLETICLKCLEKDPNKRYASAAALADDLDRWCSGEPILARRAGPLERAVKWTRRNPAGAGLVALGAVAVAAVIWGIVALAYNAELVEGKQKLEAANGELSDAKLGLENANRRLAGLNGELTTANGKLDAANHDLRTTNDKIDAAYEREKSARVEAVRKGEQVERLLTAIRFQNAVRLWQEGRLERAVEVLGGRVPGHFEGRTDPEYALAGIAPVRTGEVGPNRVEKGGRYFESTTAAEIDDSGSLVLVPGGNSIAVPDGLALPAAKPGTGGAVPEFAQGTGAERAVRSADGELVVTLGPTTARVWSRQGECLLVYAPETGRLFGADVRGRRVTFLSLGVERCVRLLSLPVSPRVQLQLTERGRVECVRFRPDGSEVVVSSSGGIRSVAVPGGGALRSLAGGSGMSGGRRVEYSRCGQFVGAIGDGGKALTVHDAGTGAKLVGFEVGAWAQELALSPDGALAAAAHRDGVTVFDRRTGAAVCRFDPRDTKGHWVCALTFSPDGARLAVGTFKSMSDSLDAPGTASIWTARTGQKVYAFPSDPCGAWRLAWSPDGTRLAVASGVHWISRGTAKVWDVGTGHLVYHLQGHTECVWGVSFSPDGRRLATCTGHRNQRAPRADGGVKIWDMETGLELLSISGDRATPFDVGFSPDGRWLGAGYADGQVRVWALRPDLPPRAPAPRAVPTAG